MKADKIRDIDAKELELQANQMEEQIFRLKFQLTLGQTEALKKLRVVKKDRARILTILRERQMAAKAEGEN
jgi:large subunit ribosomal protein L29